MHVNETQFEAYCLSLMQKAYDEHIEITVMKNNKPWVKILPAVAQPKKRTFNAMKASVIVKENIIKPINERWNAEH